MKEGGEVRFLLCKQRKQRLFSRSPQTQPCVPQELARPSCVTAAVCWARSVLCGVGDASAARSSRLTPRDPIGRFGCRENRALSRTPGEDKRADRLCSAHAAFDRCDRHRFARSAEQATFPAWSPRNRSQDESDLSSGARR